MQSKILATLPSLLHQSTLQNAVWSHQNGEPASDDNLPESFHLYPQRQAIEEGFILDVLQGYVPYKTAFKLGGDAVDNDKGLILKQRRKP